MATKKCVAGQNTQKDHHKHFLIEKLPKTAFFDKNL